jgi:hypothetical protein
VFEAGPPPLGLHLQMGPDAADKFRSLVRNVEEDRLRVVMGAWAAPE